jgi:protein tyrosine/serine phosphatase
VTGFDGWLDLQGTANTRDIGGLPAGGGRIRRRLLIRSDNLQDLTPADIQVLTDEVGVRTILDLRTDAERADEGPAPLNAREDVVHFPLSFIPENELRRLNASVVLPDRWEDGAVGAYLHYVRDRPESFAAAVRRLADPAAGAAIVHCAAGKDRTGLLVAVVLDVLGTDRELIAADYDRTNQRIDAIFARLAASQTYAVSVHRIGLDAHRVQAQTISKVLATLDEQFGSPAGFLRSAGVTDAELARLATRFIEPT